MKTLMTPQTDKLGKAFADAGFRVRFVGGCVRDALLGVTPKDLDFCTDATPDEMKDLAKSAGFGFVPTGVQHGTATLVVDGEPFEVTTLRVDVETDGRHAEVEFTKSFEVDAERRDLTFNAMSMDFDGQVFDYFNGRQDLKDRVVRFVGDARKRVEEDYLRVLRYFRFAARFDATMDADTLQMFSDVSVLEGLNKVSVERFWQEMQKLLDPSMPARVRVVGEMFKSQVNRAVGVFRFNPVDMLRSDDALSALATMVHQTDLDKFMNFWKLSSAEEKKVRWMVVNRVANLTEETVEVMMVMEAAERDWVVSACEVAGEPALAQYVRDFKAPTFPVTGKDLMDAGMTPGPDMGARLKRMKKSWMFSRWAFTKEQLMGVD